MKKQMTTAAVVTAALLFGASPALALGVDTTNDPKTFAQLGTACSAANVGSRATITDAPAASAWGTTVTVGGGTATVAIYCDGGGWKVYAGGNTAPPPPPPPDPVLPPPTTSQGNYGTGCAGGSCRTFDDNWVSATLDTSKWLAGLYINGQYLNGGVGLAYPFSGWTIGNVGGGSETVFFDYPYGYPTNTASVNFLPLSKDTDGSLRLAFAANAYVSGFSSKAKYAGAAIASAYTPATMINRTGGMVQYRAKFDIGLNYGSYPGMQCSATGATGSGTSYNSNFEHGYTWTGTALTNVGMGVNNLTAGSSNIPGATSATGVYQVPTTNDLRSWHVYAIEYSGDSTKTWRFYVDGALVNTVPTSHPNGTDFNCSFQLFNSPAANNSWHSAMSTANPPPFYAWISDWQFYKKPGT